MQDARQSLFVFTHTFNLEGISSCGRIVVIEQIFSCKRIRLDGSTCVPAGLNDATRQEVENSTLQEKLAFLLTCPRLKFKPPRQSSKAK